MTAWTSFLAVMFVFGKVLGAQARLEWKTNSGPDSSWVEITGLEKSILDKVGSAGWSTAQWQKLLSVYVEPGDDPLAILELPPMFGSYKVEANAITFRPQFPLQAGIQYLAMFRPGELPGAAPGTDVLTAKLKIPARSLTPKTVVETIFPTSAELPENLLKFYVQFSGPMSGGAIYDYIHLEDESGKPVELPFLEIDEELWNPEMTRLTLFIDPGRIKRGVKPLEDIGPALEAGKSFVLKIDSAWHDADGAHLKSGFEKRFKVTTPDRESPDAKKWRISLPNQGTREPLKVYFGEPLDHALALRLLHVQSPNGSLVNGNATLSEWETLWIFTPAQAWATGRHQLRFENILEDLAGNSLGKPFEVDLFEGVQRKLNRTILSREFEIK